jgi:hypothetical protein
MKLDTQTVLEILKALITKDDSRGISDTARHAVNLADELERQVAAHNREQSPVEHFTEKVGYREEKYTLCPRTLRYASEQLSNLYRHLVHSGDTYEQGIGVEKACKVLDQMADMIPDPTQGPVDRIAAKLRSAVQHAASTPATPADAAYQRMDYLSLEKRYEELIFAVQRCFPGETRHQTALRYIRETEAHCSDGPAVNATPHEGPLECPPPVGQGPHFKHGSTC